MNYIGWLSPEGKFYPCSYYEHSSWARENHGCSGGYELEDRGWIRLTLCKENYSIDFQWNTTDKDGKYNPSFNRWTEQQIVFVSKLPKEWVTGREQQRILDALSKHKRESQDVK